MALLVNGSASAERVVALLYLLHESLMFLGSFQQDLVDVALDLEGQKVG